MLLMRQLVRETVQIHDYDASLLLSLSRLHHQSQVLGATMQRILSGRWVRWRAGLRSHLAGRALSHLTRSRRPGQTLAESAITSAMVVMVLLVTLQLSLVAAQAYSAQQVAQSTARWLAVRIDTIDSAVVTQANTYATGLPGMGSGGLASVAVSPTCTALTAGKCAGRESGDAITVTVTTSLSAVMFLPTSFGVAPFRFTLPSTMPAIAYTVLLE
jgi:hypothetical protein